MRLEPATWNQPRAVLEAVDRDAADDSLPLAVSRFVLWLPVAGTIALALVYVAHARLYYWLLLEDHPIEWLQFAVLVFTSLAAAVATLRLWRQDRRLQAAIMAMAVLGALVLAGEEISWGERVFRLATPSDLAEINVQREMTLHNLKLGAVSLNDVSDILKLLLGIGGTALALLARRHHGWLSDTWLRDLAPPLATVPGFALMVVYDAVMLGTGTTVSPAIVYQEWVELCVYVGIAVTATCCATRAAPVPDATLDHLTEPSERHHGRTRLLLTAAGVVTLTLTVVFAKMTADTGIVPGNVPPSLVDLYMGR